MLKDNIIEVVRVSKFSKKKFVFSIFDVKSVNNWLLFLFKKNVYSWLITLLYILLDIKFRKEILNLVLSHKLKILIVVVRKVIPKNIIVDRWIKSISLLILNLEIKKEKEEEISLVLVNDSKNNKAEPREMNSKRPLSIFINSIPINWYRLFESNALNNKNIDLNNL